MVLLLGKEKEGVPIELLNQVDFCVEIPQFGTSSITMIRLTPPPTTTTTTTSIATTTLRQQQQANRITLQTCNDPQG